MDLTENTGQEATEKEADTSYVRISLSAIF